MTEFLSDIVDPVNKNLHIYLLLDNSGSMQPIKAATISGVNEFVISQKLIEDDVDTTFTLAKFAGPGSLQVVTENKPIKDVTEITTADYGADGGSTALYDAIETSLNNLENSTSENDNVMVVIMTDGQENASQHGKKDDIFGRITKLQETNKWTFLFLGANQDSYAEGTSLGVAGNSTLNWQATNTGVRLSSATYGAYAGATRSHIASTGNVDTTLDVNVIAQQVKDSTTDDGQA